ncbi:peptidylprolyl isomerase [Litoribacillus peritrichatus]|uniref:Peptidyl-prolyl cis-trans isomerase n=1 Tax=Litoribacillus peritrichatus TaxID=718191 RepID=A0ABP7MA63_9GAMM
MTKTKQLFSLLTSLITFLFISHSAHAESPKVVLETNHGNITIVLNQEKAPKTVENFLQYVNDGFYNGVIFHRVIPHFMIQTGGFDKSMTRKATRAPIENEATNGLSNKRGTVAMARTSSINSATSQFFINGIDNLFLDHKDKSSQKFGYAVFGEITSDSYSTLDAISAISTTAKYGHQNVPTKQVIIEKAYQIKEAAETIDASSNEPTPAS